MSILKREMKIQLTRVNAGVNPNSAFLCVVDWIANLKKGART